MFYEPAKRNHGLPRDPFKACVVPRPIGWVTTMDGEGRVNLAPYSFFNAIAGDPPMVAFAPGGYKDDGSLKDSLAFARAGGEFTCNLATWDLREQMNLTSAGLPAGQDEAAHAGLTLVPAALVKPPRVKESPIHLECKLWQILDLPPDRTGEPNNLVIGTVVGVHIDDAVLTGGLVDLKKIRPIARLGYMDYAVVDTIFSMQRPPGGG
jgi:flavin reductase (DIM6/NTAB) family NADH-FMN oxidoreductase RutF